MSDATDSPILPAPAATPPPRRRSRLGALALLVAVITAAAAAAGGWWFWQQLAELRAQQSRLATSAAVAQGLEGLSKGQAELRQQLTGMAEEAARVAQAADQARQAQADMVAAQQALAERVNRLDAQSRANQAEWLRSEAAYLAKVALFRLRFHRDVDGALTALRLADQTLARLGTEALPARQAIRNATDRLMQLRLPDTNALAERLEVLNRGVDLWPLEMQLQEARAEDAARDAPPAEGWRGALERAWSRFTGSLGKLVTVRRGRDLEPLLAPEERYFLYHNLRLRLESARIALLVGDQDLFRRSLSRAAEWIERYYALGEPAVDAALKELAELRAIDIQPALPDLEKVLEPVTRQ